MWKSRLTQEKDTQHELAVIVSRDDLDFVIRVSDWWIMSATRHLADKALKETKYDFRASDCLLRSDGRPY